MNQKDFKKTINEILTEGKIEGKDIKNIEITNKDFSIINITLPLEYSDTYRELTY